MIKYARAQMSQASTGKRTTVSMTDVVADMADKSMQDDGYDNFSAYVAELIRRDYKARAKNKPRGEVSSDVTAGAQQALKLADNFVSGEAAGTNARKGRRPSDAGVASKKKRSETNPNRAPKEKP